MYDYLETLERAAPEGVGSTGSPRAAWTDSPGVVTRWLPIESVSAGPASVAGAGAKPAEANAPLTITASVESEDRAGDLVLASGWDLRAYERNPVVLWAHQHIAPPIGRSLRAWVEGKSLLATIEFAPTPFAQEVRRLYEGGFLRGVSVGFRALEVEPRVSHGTRRSLLFKRQELLEISAAPVPLHPDTLAGAQAGYARARTGEWGQDEDVAQGAQAEIRRLWEQIGQLTQ